MTGRAGGAPPRPLVRSYRRRVGRDADRLTFLAAASAILSRSLDYHETLREVARLAVVSLADCCTVDLLDAGGRVRRIAATHVQPTGEPLLHDLTVRPARRIEQTDAIAQALRTGEAQLQTELDVTTLRAMAIDEEHVATLSSLGPCSAMVVPLCVRDRQLGALSFARSVSGHPYSTDDLLWAEALAGHAASAIENAVLRQEALAADETTVTVNRELREQVARERAARAEAEDGARRLALLSAVSTVLASGVDEARALRDVARALVPRVADLCCFFVMDAAGSHEWRIVEHADPAMREATEALERYQAPGGVSTAGPAPAAGGWTSLGAGEPLLIPDLPVNRPWAFTTDPEHEHLLRALRPTSLLVLPLGVGDKTCGVLSLATANGRRLGEDDLPLAQEVARRVVNAIERTRLRAGLIDREERLAVLVAQLIGAHEEERRRVAYEIHDGLAQVAAAVHQHAQAFARTDPPASDDGRRRLETVLRLAQRCVGEARRAISSLRPIELDDFGLAAALRVEAEALRVDGWDVVYDDALGSARLAQSAEIGLFRVVQEALSNVRRHAGVTPVRVALGRRAGGVSVEVVDRGCGFDPSRPVSRSGPGERVGLVGMRERIALLGGSLSIESQPGAGTRIGAWVPEKGGEDG